MLELEDMVAEILSHTLRLNRRKNEISKINIKPPENVLCLMDFLKFTTLLNLSFNEKNESRYFNINLEKASINFDFLNNTSL